MPSLRSTALVSFATIALATALPRAAQAQAAAPMRAAPDGSLPPARLVSSSQQNAPNAAAAVDDPLLAPPPEAPRTLKSWDEALSLVRTQSPDYRHTYDSILRAEAQTRIAKAGVLPNVSGQGMFIHEFLTTQQSVGGAPITFPEEDVWGAGGTLLWPIGSPRAWYAIGTAHRATDAAVGDMADKRRLIAQALVGLILKTLATLRAAELNRVGLRAALERLELARTKVRLQLAAELDVDRAQQDADAARAAVIIGDEALRQSREALGIALGSAIAIAADGHLDLGSFEKTVASTCRLNEQIEQRADIVAARTRVDVAERVIKDAYLQFAPTISVQSQLAWASPPIFGPATTWSAQAVLSVPVWDGGARYGAVRDASAAADQARQTLASTRLAAVVGLAQAKRAVGVNGAQLDVAREQRDLAVRIDQRTREAYVLGLGTSLDLVTSAQALRVAELNLVLLEFQGSQARAQAVLANAECAY